MLTLKGFLIGSLAVTAIVAPSTARAQQMFILYDDSGIAWRIGQHDHENERRQIELDYAQDVLNAKDDYNAAVDAANQSNDQQDMLLAASQRLQNDLQAAEDRRISRLDGLYPNRWNDLNNYPDLILVGYGGPCHFCAIDIVGNSIGWLSFFLPYPGYSKPCLFGWQYGQRHQFGDVRIARTAYRSRFEANLRLHPSTPADLAFHNANRFVQTRHRSDQGHTQADDVKFMSNNHLPPARVNPPSIPRAAHTPIRNAGTGSPPSYVPRATNPRPTNTNGRNTGKGNATPPARTPSYIPRATGTNGRAAGNGKGSPPAKGGNGGSNSGGRGGSNGKGRSSGG